MLEISILIVLAIAFTQFSCGRENRSNLNMDPLISSSSLIQPTLLKVLWNNGDSRFCSAVFIDNNLALTDANCVFNSTVITHIDTTPPLKASPSVTNKVHINQDFLDLTDTKKSAFNYAIVEFDTPVANAEEIVSIPQNTPTPGDTLFLIYPRSNLDTYEINKIFRQRKMKFMNVTSNSSLLSEQELINNYRSEELYASGIVVDQNFAVIGLRSPVGTDAQINQKTIEHSNLTDGKINLFLQTLGLK